MNIKYLINVGRLMGMLPKPRRKCTLHDDRAETLDQLEIIHVTATDGDYYDGTNLRILYQLVQQES